MIEFDLSSSISKETLIFFNEIRTSLNQLFGRYNKKERMIFHTNGKCIYALNAIKKEKKAIKL